jgi:CRP/FNR family transcriptional regulator, cyclic AMP receptor protein
MVIKELTFMDRFERLRITKEQKIAALAANNWPEVLGIDPAELAHLADYLTPYLGAQNAVVFSKGDEESFMCFINSGSVLIYASSREMSGEAISALDKGNLVGEMALIDGEPRSAYAYTASETVLYVMTRSSFARIAEEHPAIWGKLLFRIARLMSQRLRKTNENLGRHLHLKWRRILHQNA